MKFKEEDENFHKSIDEIIKLDITDKDLIHGFPLFTGHVNLARYLFFYDLYKQTYQLAGDIADVGTWKGYSFVFFAKLVQLFEPYSFTKVHAYDWFKGMKGHHIHENSYIGEYETLIKLLELQKLTNSTTVNVIDLTKDLPDYFKNNPHMRYKLCFIDCGIKDVLEESLKYFFPRIVKGGILIMDHYNHEISPYESEIVDKYIGNNKILHCPFVRQPTAYIVVS